MTGDHIVYIMSKMALLLLPSGILVAHHLQSITPGLALGGELVYHRRPGEEGTVTSFLGRYTGKSCSVLRGSLKLFKLDFENLLCNSVSLFLSI